MTAKEEEDFPRSIIKDTVPKDKKISQLKKSKTAQKNDVEESFEDSLHHVSRARHALPNLSTLQVGSLVLGSVAHVTDSGLLIDLPNNLIGFAKYPDVIDLPKDETASSPRINVRDVAKAPFKLGSHVACKVLGVKFQRVLVSLKPSVINKGIAIDNIIPGILLPTSVKAHEDHGLLLSLDTTTENSAWGFIKYTNKSDLNSSENASDDCDDKEIAKIKSLHPVLSTCYLVVESVNPERNSLNFAWPWKHKQAMTVSSALRFNCVRPGLLIDGHVTSVEKQSGLEEPISLGIKCLGALDAWIPAVLMKSSLSSTDPSPGLHDKVTGRVVHVNYRDQHIHVSLLQHTRTWKGPNGHPYKPLSSDSLYLAKVVERIPQDGFLCLLKPKQPQDEKALAKGETSSIDFTNAPIGFCELTKLSDDGIKKGVLRKFYTNSVHDARIVVYNSLQRWYNITCKASQLTESVLVGRLLEPGQIVRGKVHRRGTHEVVIRISSNVYGKIPLEHLTDVPLPQVPMKFYIGKSVKTRVLYYDHVRDVLVLTAKKTLKLDENPLVKFENIAIGQQAWGWFNKDSNAVNFYNNLTTSLNAKEVEAAREMQLDLSHGALVKCLVTHIDVQKHKFHVTIDTGKIALIKSKKEKAQRAKKRHKRHACKLKFENYISSKRLRSNPLVSKGNSNNAVEADKCSENNE